MRGVSSSVAGGGGGGGGVAGSGGHGVHISGAGGSRRVSRDEFENQDLLMDASRALLKTPPNGDLTPLLKTFPAFAHNTLSHNACPHSALS